MNPKRWLSVAVGLLASCGGSAPESVPGSASVRPNACELAKRDDARGAVQAWADAPEAKSHDCLVAYSRSDAENAALILASLDERVAAGHRDPATLTLLEAVAPNARLPAEDKAEVYLSLAQHASESGSPDVARRAYKNAIGTPGVPKELANAARQELARIQLEAGESAEAEKNLTYAVLADPGALSAVATLVRLLERTNGDTHALCKELFRLERIEQTKRCVLALSNPKDRDFEILMQALAKSGLLRREEAEAIAPRAGDWLPVKQCYEGKDNPTFRGYYDSWLRPEPRPGTGSVYSKLADGVDDPMTRRCFLAYASFDCVMGRGSCSEPSAVARYAATLEGAELRKFIDALFEKKGQAYAQLARRGTAEATRTLFHYHVTLSHLFAALPESGKTDYQTTSFQVARARCFWSKLHPGEPFFEELLPETLRGKFTQPNCPH